MDEMELGGGCWKLASARKRPDLLSVIAAGQRPATSKVGTWSSQRSDRGHEVSTLMVAVARLLKNCSLPAACAARSFSSISRRNSFESTRTGRMKRGRRHAIQRWPSSEMSTASGPPNGGFELTYHLRLRSGAR